MVSGSGSGWERVRAAPGKGGQLPTARGGAGADAVGGTVYVFGGASRDGRVLKDLWALDVGAEEAHAAAWRRADDAAGGGSAANAASPSERSGATLTAAGGGRLYLFGGQDPRTGQCFNDMFCFSVGEGVWRTVTPRAGGRPPSPRNEHTATFLPAPLGEGGKEGEGFIVVFGGGSPEAGQLDDVHVFSTREECWLEGLEVTGQPPGRREMHAAAWCGPDVGLVVHGGRADSGEILGDAIRLGGFPVREEDGDDPSSSVTPLAQRPWRLAWGRAEGTPYARCGHRGVGLPELGLCLLVGGLSMTCPEDAECHADVLRLGLGPTGDKLKASFAPGGRKGSAPPGRFSHGVALLPRGTHDDGKGGATEGSISLVVLTGANFAEDLADVTLCHLDAAVLASGAEDASHAAKASSLAAAGLLDVTGRLVIGDLQGGSTDQLPDDYVGGDGSTFYFEEV